jgi:hypothetical protein
VEFVLETMPIRLTKDLILSGLDMRSSRSRRYKATVASVIEEFGLIHPRLLRELAGMRFILDEAPRCGDLRRHPRQGRLAEDFRPRGAS